MHGVKQQPSKQRKLPEVVRLGDLLARGTTALGIRPCAGCKKRQEAANKIPIVIPVFWRRYR